RSIQFPKQSLIGTPGFPLSGWKAALECQEPLRISLHPDAAREECPQKIPFTRKKSQPCFRIGYDFYVWLADQFVFDCQFSVANGHCCHGWFVAAENEVVNGIELSSGVTLKGKRHA